MLLRKRKTPLAVESFFKITECKLYKLKMLISIYK